MRPPFAYYGGKARMAPWIASLLPAHEVYVEPFAGSAAVLFAKTPARHEVMNDIDGDVVNFFRVLRSRPDELEVACRLTPYAREEFAAARLDEDVDDLERARRWWVRSTQSFGQVANDQTGWSISLAQTRDRPHQLVDRVAQLAAVAERLAPVFIENDDALSIIERYDRPDAALYVDCPYLDVTRTALAGRGRARNYTHEFATEAQHRALAGVLADCAGAVLLSGYPSALYDDLYGDWWSVSRGTRKTSGAGRVGCRDRAVEVIWSNRPLGALDFEMVGR